MDNNLKKYFQVLENLSPSSKALWGKMTAQHMVEHLILSVQMGNGKLTVECFNSPKKLPALKRFLLSNRPLPKLFVNPLIGTDLLQLKFTNLVEAKENLKKEIDDYYNCFEKNPYDKN